MAADINVLPAIQRFEEEMRHDVEETRGTLLLAILERWERDSDLTVESRRRAKELLWEFGHSRVSHVLLTAPFIGRATTTRVP
jgi:hypothetical protein